MEKGFDEKDPEVLAEIKKDLENRLEIRINSVIAEALPQDKLEEFGTVIDKNNEEEMVAYVKKYVPDIDEKVASELLSFRSAYLG
jgi:flagellar motor switch protein FliG